MKTIEIEDNLNLVILPPKEQREVSDDEIAYELTRLILTLSTDKYLW